MNSSYICLFILIRNIFLWSNRSPHQDLLNSIHQLSPRSSNNKQKIPFLFLLIIFNLRCYQGGARILHTLFLAAQKGWPRTPPVQKNKLERCLSTDVSRRIVTWIRFLTPLDVVVDKLFHPLSSSKGLTLKNSPLPRFYLATTAWRGDCRNGTDPLFCISVKRDGRRLRNLPPPLPLSLSLSYSHSLSVPLLRVGRSMSRLDMWRMKGAEQPTCTRETIFFSFLSFPPSLFLFSFFFLLFSLSFSCPPPLPLFKAAPLCFRARATFQYRIVVLKKSEWMRWRDKKKKKKKKGGGTIVALLSTTTNFMLLARYWPIPSILPLIYIYI